MNELKPCPFCGGEAALVPTLDTTVREWFVTCGNLECSVLACHTKRYYTEAEAVAAWNSRAERTCECIMCAYFENKSTCGAYCNYFDRELGDDYDGGCTWGVLSGCKAVGE